MEWRENENKTSADLIANEGTSNERRVLNLYQNSTIDPSMYRVNWHTKARMESFQINADSLQEAKSTTLMLAREELNGYLQEFLEAAQDIGVSPDLAEREPVYNEKIAIEFISKVVQEECNENGYYEMMPCDYHDLLSFETLKSLTQQYQKEKAEYSTLKLEHVISDYLQDEYGGKGLDAMGQVDMYRHIKNAIAKEPPITRYHVDSYLEDPNMSLFEKFEQCGYNGVSFDVKDYVPRDYPIKLDKTAVKTDKEERI